MVSVQLLPTFVHLKVLEYIPGEIDYVIMPYKDNYLVGDTIEFECIKNVSCYNCMFYGISEYSNKC